MFTGGTIWMLTHGQILAPHQKEERRDPPLSEPPAPSLSGWRTWFGETGHWTRETVKGILNGVHRLLSNVDYIYDTQH